MTSAEVDPTSIYQMGVCLNCGKDLTNISITNVPLWTHTTTGFTDCAKD